MDAGRVAEVLATIFTVLAAVWKISKMTGKLEASIDTLTKVVEKMSGTVEKQKEDHAGTRERVAVLENAVFGAGGHPHPYRVEGFTPRDGE